MTSETISALVAAFNGLGSLYGVDGDFTLGDVGNVDTEGVTLCLSRSVSIGCGDYEDESHSIRFTWDELMDGRPSDLALTRWKEAKRADDAERERHNRELAAEEAAKAKRKRAAGKGARKRRELATLARLKAKYES